MTGKQGFLREIEDKEDSQGCLGGRDGAHIQHSQRGDLLGGKSVLAETQWTSRNSLGIQGLGDRAGVGHLGVGACPSILIPQLPRLGRAHPACRPSRLHSCGHPQGLVELAAFEHQGLTREIRVTKGWDSGLEATMGLQRRPCSSTLPGRRQAWGIGITPRLTGKQTVATSVLRTGPARVLGLQEMITAALPTGGDLWVEHGWRGGWMADDIPQFSLVSPQIIYTTPIP